MLFICVEIFQENILSLTLEFCVYQEGTHNKKKSKSCFFFKEDLVLNKQNLCLFSVQECMYIYRICLCLMHEEGKEGTGSPGNRVEMFWNHHMGAGNR